MDRLKIIQRTSIIGIITNILLAGFKIAVGMIASSISILMDGVNNLADAGSSTITIIGATLAGKQPDRKHPFGYGRMEYISSLVIGGLVLYTGVTSIIESVKKIIHPETADYSVLALIIIAVALAVKFGLAMFTLANGKKTNSDALIGSGKDAFMDCVLSSATLIAALILKFTGLGLEAYLATVISAFIIKAGIEILLETISKILGEPGEVEDAIAIKQTIGHFEKVHGVYDLILHDYGPDAYVASVHIEVDETMNAEETDKLTREITDKVFEEHNVFLSAVGIYSRNLSNPEAAKLKVTIRDMVLAMEGIKGFHGFYADLEAKSMSFDLVVTLDIKDRKKAYMDALEAVENAYPEYRISAGMDMDLSEAAHEK